MTEAVATDVDLDIGTFAVAGHPVAWRPERVEPRVRRSSPAHGVFALVALDAVVAAAAAFIALITRLGVSGPRAEIEAYWYWVSLIPVVWLVALAAAGAYDRRVRAVGAEEFRRVGNAGIWLLAAVAVSTYITRLEVSRSLVAVTIMLVTAMALGARLGARRLQQRSIAQGRPLHRVVVVGSVGEVRDLVRHLGRYPRAGFSVVGACVPDPVSSVRVGDTFVPVVGGVFSAPDAVRSVDADTVAVAGSGALSSIELRQLSWELEGSGAQLVVAPAITDIAGSRIFVRPVHGLPLMHVEEPRLSGFATSIKALVDRAAAGVLVLALLPILVGVGLAIRLTSPGPALFRQTRVGRGGKTFTLVKFRTMHVDAEERLVTLAEHNEHDGPLFKIRQDPRVTGIGRRLRRHSLDELPQLWNVLMGQMSLVGPRPALPAEVERYGSDARRRLLVKPGMTGLWQVSGRSDLAWDEAVRLDLYYVENWSITLDALILARTVSTVALGVGGY